MAMRGGARWCEKVRDKAGKMRKGGESKNLYIQQPSLERNSALSEIIIRRAWMIQSSSRLTVKRAHQLKKLLLDVPLPTSSGPGYTLFFIVKAPVAPGYASSENSNSLAVVGATSTVTMLQSSHYINASTRKLRGRNGTTDSHAFDVHATYASPYVRFPACVYW
ncbi:uncharacterized protein BJ212DRAFT_1302858 [Suillus subaureus]|uniref:Uncharacterized protein n=1 Tax=Suillus subaureus TaxID=48587 RepID=A0A9P7E2D7_9AGAM|nr:uncharacterized protein BJ212DRAFT_1302858 [Suillus subaureus]KAG1808971.1 hypothetical protein BJ212DRAFT_1302858 [Suillus subaureus]